MLLGFIGLGIMGKPMAKNLLKNGYEVMVNNRSRGPVDDLVSLGAKSGTYEEIGNNCRVIFTMLPNSPDVKKVVLGKAGLIDSFQKDQILIDMSSINPQASIEIAQAIRAKGGDMLDAPVSGGETGAIEASLAFMVGGKKEIFDKYKDLLLVMGKSAVLCGDVGAGNTTKLVNQLIVASNIQALAEGLILAKKAGVDPETVVNAIKGGLAGSKVMDTKAQMMIEGDDKPGFKVDLNIKDLNNVLDFAHTIGAYVPMCAQANEVLNWLSNGGKGGADHSAMVQFYEKLT